MHIRHFGFLLEFRHTSLERKSARKNLPARLPPSLSVEMPVSHSAWPDSRSRCLDAGHQISDGSFELAKPMRNARRYHDYIAWPHPAALAALNRASDAGAGDF